MKAKLIVVGGTTSTSEVDLRLPTIVGRGRSVQLTIPHALVSRQHCEISESDGRLLVRDLDSLNGTYVGDERITEAILEPGALLTVGTVTFRAIYEIGGGDDSPDDGRQAASGAASRAPKRNGLRDAGESPNPNLETVPIAANAASDTKLPLHIPAQEKVPAQDKSTDEPGGETVSGQATETVSDPPDATSLESAAKHSN